MDFMARAGHGSNFGHSLSNFLFFCLFSMLTLPNSSDGKYDLFFDDV